MYDEKQLQEVAYEPPDQSERLQEGVVEVAAVVGGVASVVGAGAGLSAVVYARAQVQMMREEREQERAAFAAEQDELRREMELENRYLRAQLYGLDALDAMDRGDYYSPGFGVDDDYSQGFEVE